MGIKKLLAHCEACSFCVKTVNMDQGSCLPDSFRLYAGNSSLITRVVQPDHLRWKWIAGSYTSNKDSDGNTTAANENPIR